MKPEGRLREVVSMSSHWTVLNFARRRIADKIALSRWMSIPARKGTLTAHCKRGSGRLSDSPLRSDRGGQVITVARISAHAKPR